MIWLLGKLGGLLAGPLLIPALVVAGLWLGGKYLELRDQRAMAAGERMCDARWEEKIRQEEREASLRREAQMRAELAAERETAEGLRSELDRINAETAELRELIDNSGGGRCLSDGVWDALRRYTQPKSAPGS